MKLKDIKLMSEMARTAEVCSNCGRTKADGHYYYAKDKLFHCKGMTGKVFTPGGKPGATAPTSATAPSEPVSTPSTPKIGVGHISPPVVPASNEEALAGRIKKWLEDHEVSNFKINPDGLIDVEGHVYFDDPTEKLEKFPGPVKFGTITGDFVCPVSLTILRGCPQHVGTSEFAGDFVCAHSDVVTLEGGPQTVGGSYSTSECQNLESLIGIAEKIGGSIDAEKCPKLKNLQGIHKIIRHCGGIFKLKDTPIESHVLGLLLIKGLQSVQMSNNGVQEIINKHLKTPDRNIHDVQEELIDAGFAAFAKL